MKDHELEVKFLVASLAQLEARLQFLGADLTQPQTFELNLRFDDPVFSLSRNASALRLRKDGGQKMTFKGPSMDHQGIRLRKEIEFSVSDFAAAQALLECLGFAVVLVYEKYRSVYQLDAASITLDRMPYGTFVEIESEDPNTIKRLCTTLGLDWTKRISESYVLLFEKIKNHHGLTFTDITFENFEGLNLQPLVPDLLPADLLDN
jgi:adenylate cyclase class 2